MNTNNYTINFADADKMLVVGTMEYARHLTMSMIGAKQCGMAIIRKQH